MAKLKLKSHGKKGRLIVFCGLEGCGKSSTIQMLYDHYTKQGKSVFFAKQSANKEQTNEELQNCIEEQNGDSVGSRVQFLHEMSDCIRYSEKIIEPALEAYDVVISECYVYSCIANLRAWGYEDDKWIYEVAKSIIKPDLSIFLDMPIEFAINRSSTHLKENDKGIDPIFQQILREEYITMAKEYGYLVNSEGTAYDTFEKMLPII